MERRSRRWFAAAVLLAALFVGCGNPLSEKGTAADAMDQFHERFNGKEYGKIYDTADVGFQSDNVRGDFLEYLAEVHRKLGDYKSCDNQGWSTSTGNLETRVTLRYRTTFAKGTGDEEFVYHLAGARALLRSYRIESSALDAK